MSIILAKSFTGLEGGVSFTAIEYTDPGASWAAVNSNHEVLLTWIVTSSGQKRVVGRVDGRGHSDEPLATPSLIGANSDAEGVRCCFNPSTGGWIVVYNVGTTVYYALFDATLNPSGSDTALPSTMPSGFGSDSFNLGCDEDGFFFVSWPGRVIKIDSADDTVVYNYVIDGGVRMHVHVQSGDVDVTRASGNNLVVDRYTPSFVLRDTIVVDTDTDFVAGLHAITSRYASGGFTIAWALDTTGDNIRYRTYGADGLPLYSTQTVSGTGNVDVSSNQGRFHLSIGERPIVDDQNYTFAIRATSTDSGGGRVLVLVEPTRFNPQTIRKTEFVSISNEDARYGLPVVCTSPYEMRSMAVELGSPDSMSLEVYVRQSALMGLWRIEKSARVFRDAVLDEDGADLADDTFTGYPSGSKLLGSTGTGDSDYTAENGRSGVDPDSADFEDYWGTADEENVFIGGPYFSEIARSFEENPNMFDPQISTLASELGFSAFEFFHTNRNNGWGVGSAAPEIRVTVSGNDYVLQRHADSQDTSRIVDYGVVLRLPIDAADTQSTKGMVYIAGINHMGTEAAAYAYKNYIAQHIGGALGMLVIVKYPASYDYGIDYNPASAGTIHCYPISDIDQDDFEGIR